MDSHNRWTTIRGPRHSQRRQSFPSTSSAAPRYALEAADALASLVPGARRAHGEPPLEALLRLLD